MVATGRPPLVLVPSEVLTHTAKWAHLSNHFMEPLSLESPNPAPGPLP